MYLCLLVHLYVSDTLHAGFVYLFASFISFLLTKRIYRIAYLTNLDTLTTTFRVEHKVRLATYRDHSRVVETVNWFAENQDVTLHKRDNTIPYYDNIT